MLYRYCGLLIFFLLLSSPVYAAWDLDFIETDNDGGTPVYYGWANTDGTPDDNPGWGWQADIAHTWAMPITITTACDALAINAYWMSAVGTTWQVVLYSDDSGPDTLIGKSADQSGGTINSWQGEVDLVVESGQSLSLTAATYWIGMTQPSTNPTASEMGGSWGSSGPGYERRYLNAPATWGTSDATDPDGAVGVILRCDE